MAPDAADESDQISERVNRGFEEMAAEGGPGLGMPDRSGAPGAALLGRVEALEYRVRQTMDRLTELVEAQLPEAVDGLRADLETLRLEIQATLAQAGELMAEERQQLRAQIATTVGAANRWFVRTRDQLVERLDHITEVALDTQAHAEAAAEAATAAATTLPAPTAAEPAEAEPEHDDQTAVEWDVEDLEPLPRPAPMPATVELALEAPELDALMDPLRGDVQELQLEVASMGDAVSQLRDEMARLAQRIPPRGKGVRLDPAQVDLIVEAVLAAIMSQVPDEPVPAPAKKPAKKAAPKKSPAKAAPVARKASSR